MKVMTAEEAVRRYLIDGSTVACGGFVGAMVPEEIHQTAQKLFLEEGSPGNLTVIFAAGQGDSDSKGMNHYGEEGMVSKIIAGHYGLVPRLQKLAVENKCAAYNLPQGVIAQMFRDTAAGKPGVITHVGLKTFVDPRIEGGMLNEKAKEAGAIVEIVNIAHQEKLFYHAIPIDVAIIRASYADTRGNCTFEHEGVMAEALAMCQAARNCGGKVIVQVERIVEYGCLDVRLVRLPGIYVDALVVSRPDNHMQTFGTAYNPAFCGEVRNPSGAVRPLLLNERKIIARRAAMELIPNAVVNLGIGMPEGVSVVAAEEDLPDMILTTEAGTIGGIPQGGKDFGVTMNADCILDQPAQFDFYDGGGLDMAFLGLAQADSSGNVNVSKFGPRIAGAGGFINITQNTPKVVFCGTFTAGGLKLSVKNGELSVLQEGRTGKFPQKVEQITFSGDYARESGQTVMYITERAVFQLTREGLELMEIAPGIDMEKDILSHMDFMPVVKNVKFMDQRIFEDKVMGLKSQFE